MPRLFKDSVPLLSGPGDASNSPFYPFFQLSVLEYFSLGLVEEELALASGFTILEIRVDSAFASLLGCMFHPLRRTYLFSVVPLFFCDGSL